MMATEVFLRNPPGMLAKQHVLSVTGCAFSEFVEANHRQIAKERQDQKAEAQTTVQLG